MRDDESIELPLHFTARALTDLRAIRDYTRKTWGETQADRYLEDAEAALNRISHHPGLLVARPELHPALRFYVMNKHIFVCDLSDTQIILLTVLSSKMDILSRLARLEPTLVAEVDVLRRKLHQGR